VFILKAVAAVDINQAPSEKNGSANMDAFLQDEKLGLESLVLANQAATTEFRK
jgi:hypothetical protein